MTLVIALPLYQVLQAIIVHLAVQYGLNLILVLTMGVVQGISQGLDLDAR
jgi:hypothetical protein